MVTWIHEVATVANWFGVLVNLVGLTAVLSRVTLKILPVPTRNGFYKDALNLIGHAGLYLGKVYQDI